MIFAYKVLMTTTWDKEIKTSLAIFAKNVIKRQEMDYFQMQC